MRFAVLIPLVVLLTACPQQPITPSPDASDASAMGEHAASPPGPATPACVTACTTMQQRGCKEGYDPYCGSTMTKVESDRLIVPTMCPGDAGCSVTCSWCATAKNAAEVVQKCGSSCSPQ